MSAARCIDTLAYTNPCGYCGAFHDGTCPRIKSIDYHPGGTIARVEFHDPAPVSVSPETPKETHG